MQTACKNEFKGNLLTWYQLWHWSIYRDTQSIGFNNWLWSWSSLIGCLSNCGLNVSVLLQILFFQRSSSSFLIKNKNNTKYSLWTRGQSRMKRMLAVLCLLPFKLNHIVPPNMRCCCVRYGLKAHLKKYINVSLAVPSIQAFLLVLKYSSFWLLNADACNHYLLCLNITVEAVTNKVGH